MAKKQRLAVITLVYWFLLIYIIAALVWWFIALENQNEQMYLYRMAGLKKDDIAYAEKAAVLNESKKLKSEQYIGEGATFLFLICVGAVFVYRATGKQILLSRQQNNFMMAVTHELKTPVAVAQLNLETLQKRKLDEVQQQKLIANTLKETKRLDILTNNILIASQLDANAYAVNMQELNFSELVKNCVKNFTESFAERNIQSSIEENIFVEGENILLQMLLNNLLDNALKYSPKNAAIKIDLHKKNNTAVLKVIDEGNGIAAEEKKKVFDKFYRSGNEATRTAKGTGLGLYLCKKIAQDHKGKIAVEDNQPKGSVFIFSLQAR
jgi:two-component system, OmpR family, sensor histidine kinase CiaH